MFRKKVNISVSELMGKHMIRLFISNNMDAMTTDQQKEVVTFLPGMGALLVKVFNWITRMLGKLINMLQEGWKLGKESTKNFVDSDLLSSLFQ